MMDVQGETSPCTKTIRDSINITKITDKKSLCSIRTHMEMGSSTLK